MMRRDAEMGRSMEAQKPHAVCLPFPTQGHVTPMMRLAKILHSKGIHITMVNTEFNHRRLIRHHGPDSVKGLPDFRFMTIPDGLPPLDKDDATQDLAALSATANQNCLLPFRDLLRSLVSSVSPPVSCVVADVVMGCGTKAAEMLGIPYVQFWTSSACGFMAGLQFLELLKRGIVPFKDESFLHDGTLETYIDWVPGMSNNIRLRDLPSFIRTTDPNDTMLNFAGIQIQDCVNSSASATLFCTFDELEHQVLQALAPLSSSPIYTIGPLPLLERHLIQGSDQPLMIRSISSSLWKEDSGCMEWLDRQSPNSVIYVNYGSVTMISEHHLNEFAWGLADSNHPFLWIVRPDVAMGKSATLPVGYLEEVKDRGFLAPWCAQDAVLSHPAVAVFLTHCGWNSMLEAICAGKPVLCCPFSAEQPTNCRYACAEWGIGLEVDPEAKREDVKRLVEEMMERKKVMMQNAADQWKKKAEVATLAGGSSYRDFDSFVEKLSLLRSSEQ